MLTIAPDVLMIDLALAPINPAIFAGSTGFEYRGGIFPEAS
jgi:hypothetical protein